MDWRTLFPFPSPSPKVCSTCVCRVDDGHPTISSCHPLLLYLQSFAAESFPVSQLFSSGGQTVRASASASVFPMNIKGSFPLGLTDLISCCPRDSEESSPTLQFFSSSPYLWSSSVHDSDCSHKIKTLAPWKESYDKPWQYIKKQRHQFSGKGPYSQSYGFSSSHIWMWVLDHKARWAQNNSCFWIVVLKKTPESPLHRDRTSQS